MKMHRQIPIHTVVLLGLVILSSLFLLPTQSVAESFQGPVSGATVYYNIDLPQGYETSNESYPVIYVLHGWGKDHSTQFKCTAPDRKGCDMEDGMAKKHLDLAVAAGTIEPCILVYPNGYGNSFFADSYDGKKLAETTIIRDLIPYIEANYRVKKGRAYRAVMGLRMGGYGALEYGVKFPELFCAAVGVAAGLHDWHTCVGDIRTPQCQTEIFGDNYYYFLQYSPWYNAARKKEIILQRGVGLRMVFGDDEEMLQSNPLFGKRLEQQKIEYELEIVKECTGGADQNAIRRNFDCILSKEQRDSFAFIGEHMRSAQSKSVSK